MLDEDRKRRCTAAGDLISLLSAQGYSLREIAENISVNPSTLSQWRGIPSNEGRRIGSPSDEAIRDLAMVLVDAIDINLGSIKSYIGSDRSTHSGRVWIYHKLPEILRRWAEEIEEENKIRVEVDEELSKLVKKYGEKARERLRNPEGLRVLPSRESNVKSDVVQEDQPIAESKKKRKITKGRQTKKRGRKE